MTHTRCRKNLLISGGPGHEFAVTSALVADLLAEEDIQSLVVDDLEYAFARLADDSDAFDLVTVNALRWKMEVERYADVRDEHGVTLTVDQENSLDEHVRGGGGLLALHTAVICFDGSQVWHDLAGASWDWDRSMHPPLDEVGVKLTSDGRDHPVTAGIDDFAVLDEAYGFLDENDNIVPLATTSHSGRTHPVVWARELGDGRVVTDLLGHGPDSMTHPAHAHIIRAAARWALDDRSDEAPGRGAA